MFAIVRRIFVGWIVVMAKRETERLSPLSVGRAKAPGMYADGRGLYLRLAPGGSKSWQLRYMLDGRARYMGLGSFPDFSLAEARKRAVSFRQQLADGIDPIEARRAKRDLHRLEKAKTRTFKSCAEAYIESHKSGWSNAKHAEQWRATLATYVYPVFGNLPVHSIDVALVIKALQPIWTIKSETASRVRGRVESVLDWATVSRFRTGDNPARWRGNLQALLPARAKVAKVVHHPALPFATIGPFMAELRACEGIAARALEFTILTAARTGETIGARWSEFDMRAKCWTIPGSRMKSGREHRAALSEPAIVLLSVLADVRTSDFVFPGAKPDKPLSNMAMLAVLKRMGRNEITAHGFRSTFRDWAAETTNFPREVAEAALAHTLGDKVEAAYRRGDLFNKRQQLMEAWGRNCGRVSTDPVVVPFAVKS